MLATPDMYVYYVDHDYSFQLKLTGCLRPRIVYISVEIKFFKVNNEFANCFILFWILFQLKIVKISSSIFVNPIRYDIKFHV